MNRFSSTLPIWYQLSQMLRTDILTGRLRPGQRIDAEVRMARNHAISVVPVRRALRALEQEGLIIRRPGSGTYVSDNIRTAGDATTSLETLYAREFNKRAKIVERGEVPVPSQFSSYFPDDHRFAFVRRLTFRDDRPWSYGTLYFPPEFGKQLTNTRLSRYPVYRLIIEYYGIEIARSHFQAKAVAAGTEIAGFLEIDPFSPALALSCVTFNAGGQALGAFEMTFPGDPFIFAINTPHEAG